MDDYKSRNGGAIERIVRKYEEQIAELKEELQERRINMSYDYVKCLKTYYSAIDRETVLHTEGKFYKIEKATASGFYAAETNKENTWIGIQINDPDYQFWVVEE